MRERLISEGLRPEQPLLPEIDVDSLPFEGQERLLAEADELRRRLEKRLGTIRGEDGIVKGFRTVYGHEVNFVEDNGQIAVVGLDGLAPSHLPGVSRTDALPRYASRADAITAVRTTAQANGYQFSKESQKPRPTRG